MDLSCDSFDIINVLNLVFLKNLDGHTLVCQLVHAQFHLTKGALSDSFVLENSKCKLDKIDY